MPKSTMRPPGPADLVTLNRASVVARLLSGVTHEVNNALQVIGGMAELLQTTDALPQSVVKGLQRIASQNARAAAAIQQMMAFSRQKVDVPGRMNLREIVNQAVALRSYAISRARLSIEVDVSSTGRFVVLGNAVLLQLAVLNLIINAEQALSGQKGGAIRLALDERPGSVVLRVADNGPGVDAAAREELFESFFTTRSRDEASGLGLFVTKLVAEQHGGTLTLEPQHEGATFALRLPSAP